MVAAAQTHATQPHPPTHTYSVTCSWSGSTGAGYERYSRAHVGHASTVAPAVRLSADPAFRGDPALLNPEQLLVLSAASCQLLSFLAVAARARIDVRDYQDSGHAVMTEDGKGGGRITEITLRPRITAVTEAAEDRLRRLVQLAHQQCYIAASLACPVTVEPTFEILTPYAFRDTEAAVRRLALVSEIFDPGSRAFVAARVSQGSEPALAVDLGCGPGHTTRLLAAATGARRTVGLDASGAFLAAAHGSPRAEKQAGDESAAGAGLDEAGEIEFARHDIRRVPFPTQARGADVVYARLLLAHLADVTTAIGGWVTQLAPHGVLLLDEIESIDTDQPVLAAYLDHARRLLAARGTTLHAGRLLNTALHDLAAHQPTPDFEVEYNATERLSPPVAAAAAMFGMNLAVWRTDPLFRDREAELDRLATDLAALTSAPPDAGVITWTLRRVAVRRLGSRNGSAPTTQASQEQPPAV
ncbi:OsmC family protein [Pseudofrankia sp. BMG5.36]|uniref:OsmC family protein n=1 Tax=Pseudofrankia sp. BMG5.36 TaxID=1834512 RepID=UPI000A784325|nr:OsmC family protein [Pseudofrankia sp. BMG5.36]